MLETQIAQLGQDPTAQAAGLRRLARLAGQALADPDRAQRAWEDLLRATPSDSEALAALSETYAGNRDWRALVAILERRIPLASDSEGAVALALERARIFEEELDIRSEAMATLEQIVEELDPRCLPAYARLRRLAEAGSDWARVVAVAEKQLFLEDDPAARPAQALQIGELLRDRLNDPRRAITAFERAVEIDPQNRAGLTALAALYAGAGEWQRLIAADEKLLELAPPDDRAHAPAADARDGRDGRAAAGGSQAGLRSVPPGLQRRGRRRGAESAWRRWPRPTASGSTWWRCTRGRGPRPPSRPSRWPCP